MEFLTAIAAFFGQLTPYLSALAPLLKLFAPVIAILVPVLDIVSGPISATVVYLLFPGYALWLFYLAVMTLKRSRDEGTLVGVAYGFAVPLLAIGYAIDFFVQVTFCSILFWDLPREGTMTARLKRYATQPGTKRFTMTVWIATNFLDKFDPSGYHVAETYFNASEAIEAATKEPTEKALADVDKLLAKLA